VPSSPNSPEQVILVAVPVPGLGVLSYRVPAGVARPPKGARVMVPLGGRTVAGCVVDPHAAPPANAELRDILEVVDADPFLPPVVVDLALWVGEYYASGPGDALAIAMPPSARGGQRTAFRTVTRADLVTGAPEAPPPRGLKQREALTILGEAPGGLTLPDLARRGVGAATVRSLAAVGRVRLREEIVERDPFTAGDADGAGGHWSIAQASTPGRALTDEQTDALARLSAEAARAQFRTVLLHGVTGSGKTELYLRLADAVTAAGRRVLVLVPEIALTPALAGLFRTRFGARVAIQHSGLSTGERHDQWHRIRRGDVDIVVGTRSAVFAPLERIGLIVVDEEHESSYKQEEAPRYHGRDVAVVRGRMEQALVVLGSATPSLESAANVRAGRYEGVYLTRRIFDRPLATVRVVDMRQEFAARGPEVRFSEVLTTALADRLAKGEQSLVLLNRRGFASVVFCRQCGGTIECPRCSVSLTYHRAARRLRCHYCDHAAAVPKRCAACQGEYLEQSGFGTERLEADLAARFPGARIARVDRDTVRRRGAVTRVLADVARGRIDILVGTQMIAKGHDFPAVTLVGVVSADVGLGLADFRAAERTFQLLTQVVGRAGRGQIPGEAIVQTIYPDHYSIRAAAAQDYAQFLAREMEFRTTLHYPPAVALVNVIVKGRTLEAALTGAQDLVTRVREIGLAGRVLGPAPAAIARIKEEYRAQFFIKSPTTRRNAARAAIERALAERPDLKRRTIVDVDPVSVM
jgi:primosomal protein N' (replication factor Y)